MWSGIHGHYHELFNLSLVEEESWLGQGWGLHVVKFLLDLFDSLHMFSSVCTVCVDILFYFYCVLVLGLLIFFSLHIFCSFLLSMFPTAWQPGPSRPYPNCFFITFLCCNDSIYHCLYFIKFLPCGLLKHSTERSKEEYDIQYNRFCTFILGIVISHFVFTYT